MKFCKERDFAKTRNISKKQALSQEGASNLESELISISGIYGTTLLEEEVCNFTEIEIFYRYFLKISP